jgi:hypothetical protein
MSTASLNEDHPAANRFGEADSAHDSTSKPLTPANTKERSAGVEDVVAEVPVSQPVAVRETQRLYRLKAARFRAVVAADTEDEARALATRHDALPNDWCNPEFASSEFEDTAHAHVFGDVVISVLAAPPVKRSNHG